MPHRGKRGVNGEIAAISVMQVMFPKRGLGGGPVSTPVPIRGSVKGGVMSGRGPTAGRQDSRGGGGSLCAAVGAGLWGEGAAYSSASRTCRTVNGGGCRLLPAISTVTGLLP